MLAGAPAVLAAPTVAAVAVANGDDTALVDLGRQLEAAWKIERGVYAKYSGPRSVSQEEEGGVDGAVDRCSQIVNEFEAVPAKIATHRNLSGVVLPS